MKSVDCQKWAFKLLICISIGCGRPETAPAGLAPADADAPIASVEVAQQAASVRAVTQAIDGPLTQCRSEFVDELVENQTATDSQLGEACDDLVTQVEALAPTHWGVSREMDQLLGALARAADDVVFLHVLLSSEGMELAGAIEHLDASTVALAEQVDKHGDTVASRPAYGPVPENPAEMIERAERELGSDVRGLGQLADKFDRYAYQQRSRRDFVRQWLLRHFGEIETRRLAQRRAAWATPEGGDATATRAAMQAYMFHCDALTTAYNLGTTDFLTESMTDETALVHMDAVRAASESWTVAHDAVMTNLAELKAALAEE